MSETSEVRENRVLAIASHVSHGYVGNTMATFVMQSLGSEVTAINTVYFSNHTAYKQWKGRKVSAEEIQELYNGLKQSHLNEFDMMLSGYIASKDAVKTVGGIARDLRLKSNMKPGSFFWILDPVMGDEGRIYVNEDIVPEYKALLSDADLILPNCFEAELLSGTKITDRDSLYAAITNLHKEYSIPHIVVTSVRLSSKTGKLDPKSKTLTIVGSSCRKDLTPRIFSITTASLPIFFSGTGDMFAALMTVRLREAVLNSPESKADPGTRAWRSPDAISATELPLAAACVKVVASMQAVLIKTAAIRDEELREEVILDGGSEQDELEMHLRRTKASEVRVVRFVDDLRVVNQNGFDIQEVLGPETEEERGDIES